LIAFCKSKKAACQGAFGASGGLSWDSICVFFGAFVHGETEAKFSEDNVHYWQLTTAAALFVAWILPIGR
jgi:hypothetical protein